MTNIVSVSDARNNLPTLVSKVKKNMDRVVITVHGQPAATLVSPEELDSLEETAEVLAIPNIKKDIARSRKQIKEGKFIPLSKL